MDNLFPVSKVYVKASHEDSGFYELEMPDAFRWTKKTATCFYPCGGKSFKNPRLLVVANSTIIHRAPHLALEVDGQFIGAKIIEKYGEYYYEIDRSILAGKDEIKISLNVDYLETSPVDERPLGITVYNIDIIELEGNWHDFPERALFTDQVRLFRYEESLLPALLDEREFGPDSLILDVGPGKGWTTVLFAIKTAARTIAVDLEKYDRPFALSTRAELLEIFNRHASLLKSVDGFSQDFDLRECIERCSFFEMNAENIIFKDELFDFAFSLNSFEHISKPETALAEVARLLKPGGKAFLQFMPLYYSDYGNHLNHLLDVPWAHLLYDREQIKEMVIKAGKVANEVDNILDSLNGYTLAQFNEVIANSSLKVVKKINATGFAKPESAASEEFEILKKKFPEEELTTLGMILILEK